MVKTAKNKVYYLTYLLQILASTWVKVTIRVHFIIQAIEGLNKDDSRDPGGINNLINCWHQMRRRYPRLDLSAPRPKWFPSMQAIADSRRTLD